jgi:protein-serine/threonine kinase
MSGSRRMTSEKVDVYFKQAISGLEYLHRSGIAHQDLCPENFIITISNVLKISNFEVADYSASSTSRRKDVPSRVEYAAPEVLLSSSYDSKVADMWAMGVIYMEMRRGRLLWEVAAEGADECYDRYLQVRTELWGYRPIENLDNVSLVYETLVFGTYNR